MHIRWSKYALILGLLATFGCGEAIRRGDTGSGSTVSGPFTHGTSAQTSTADRPLSQLAVGPTQVAMMVGKKIKVLQRDGTDHVDVYNTQDFTKCSGGAGSERAVMYDIDSKHWFIMNIDTTDNFGESAGASVGHICLAVSRETDGLGKFYPPNIVSGIEDHHWFQYKFPVPYGAYQKWVGSGGGYGASAYRFAVPSYIEDARMGIGRDKVVIAGWQKNVSSLIQSPNDKLMDADRSYILAIKKADLYATYTNSTCTAAGTPRTCCTGNNAGSCCSTEQINLGGCQYVDPYDKNVGTPNVVEYQAFTPTIVNNSEWDLGYVQKPGQYIMVPMQLDGYAETSPGHFWLMGLDRREDYKWMKRVMRIDGVPPNATIASDTESLLDSITQGEGPYFPPVDAKQRGTTQKIGTNDTRVVDFKFNSGHAVAVWPTTCGTTTCIAYNLYNDTGSSLEYYDGGYIGDGVGAYYHTPAASIAANGKDIAFVFNCSYPAVVSPPITGLYTSICGTGRHWTEANPEYAILTNTKVYHPLPPNGNPYYTNWPGGVEPWGHYSELVVDPVSQYDTNNGSVYWWGMAQFPRSPDGQNGSIASEWSTQYFATNNATTSTTTTTSTSGPPTTTSSTLPQYSFAGTWSFSEMQLGENNCDGEGARCFPVEEECELECLGEPFDFCDGGTRCCEYPQYGDFAVLFEGVTNEFIVDGTASAPTGHWADEPSDVYTGEIDPQTKDLTLEYRDEAFDATYRVKITGPITLSDPSTQVTYAEINDDNPHTDEPPTCTAKYAGTFVR